MSYVARGALILVMLCAALAAAAQMIGGAWRGGVLVFPGEMRGVFMADVGTGIVMLLTPHVAGSHLELSPGGRDLTFSDGSGVLTVSVPDGESRYLLTADDTIRRSPTWSPDATRIAFVGTSNIRNQIFITDSTGSPPQLISAPDVNDFSPQWSPDGSTLAFISLRGGFPQIYLMDSTGGNVRQITRNRYVDSYAWSPSGAYVAFVARTDTDTEIYSVHVQDGTEINLSRSAAHDYLFAWSPHDDRLAFASTRNSGRAQLYSVNADGSDLHALSDGGEYYELLPMWSPDGRTLAFFCGTLLRELDICLLESDGSRRMLADTRYNNFAPSWSPDARQIAFLSTRDGSLQLYVMDVHNPNSARRITINMGLTNAPPMWIP